MVASRISQVGGGGKASRYGGEEFTVVFPGANKEDALYPLDELRKAAQNFEVVIRQGSREDEVKAKVNKKHRQKVAFRTADKKVSVTISIGINDHQTAGGTPEDVLKAADEALYFAKNAGRNQVSMGKSARRKQP
jgi:PleD family two-component response regulator